MKELKYKNNEVGARVIIPKLLIRITPEKGWEYLKNVGGLIVERGEHEQYYHISTGGNTYVTKHIIDNDCFPNYAIRLDNDITDIEGNNIVVIREWDIKFKEFKVIENPITKKEYEKAKKVVEEFENYDRLKQIGKW